jgi:hypothetical protein
MALQSDGTWREYSDVVVDAGSRVNRDLLVGENGSSLFVMTTNAVRKRARYLTFGKCLISCRITCQPLQQRAIVKMKNQPPIPLREFGAVSQFAHPSNDPYVAFTQADCPTDSLPDFPKNSTC